MTGSLSIKSRTGKTIAVIGIILPLLFCGCAARKAASEWHTQAIIADGSEAEWPAPPQFYDSSKKASVRLSNDAESIRICFATNDRGLKMILATEGISVWLDPDGGKKQSRRNLCSGEQKPLPSCREGHQREPSARTAGIEYAGNDRDDLPGNDRAVEDGYRRRSAHRHRNRARPAGWLPLRI